jgi:hypothetical protein
LFLLVVLLQELLLLLLKQELLLTRRLAARFRRFLLNRGSVLAVRLVLLVVLGHRLLWDLDAAELGCLLAG